jgi:hypothetical protein
LTSPRREPAWLTAMIDQRMALMEEHLGNPANVPANVVMTPLTEPEEDATNADRERWERTCDNCGTYCDNDTPFYTGSTVRMRGNVQVIFMFGVCAPCKEAGDEETRR